MSRQRTITFISIGIIFLLIIGVVWFLFGLFSGNNDTNPASFDSPDFVPFGEATPREGGALDIQNDPITDRVLNEYTPPPERTRMRALGQAPVAGFTFVESNEETFVRFIEEETGHVFDLDFGGVRPERIANTTAPQIREAFFLQNGTSLVIRYFNDSLSNLRTFVGTLTQNKSSADAPDDQSLYTLDGVFFEEDIVQSIPNPAQDRFLTHVLDDAGSRITLYEGDSLFPQQSQGLPLQELLFEWVGPTLVTAQTKASHDIDGFLYVVSENGDPLRTVLGPLPGLTARMNNNGTHVLYSYTRGDRYVSGVYAVQSGSFQDTSLFVMPEKCVWSTLEETSLYCSVPDTLFPQVPDVWYQGKVHFNDTLWKIDATTGLADFLFDPRSEYTAGLDGTNLLLNQGETALLVKDLISGRGWVIDITPEELFVETATSSEETLIGL